MYQAPMALPYREEGNLFDRMNKTNPVLKRDEIIEGKAKCRLHKILPEEE
jgi:hypothetical protein